MNAFGTVVGVIYNYTIGEELIFQQKIRWCL